MKLSDNTLTILKNFATVNGGVVLKPGNFQRTVSADKAILVEATLEDTFPNEFGIYDLNQFLGNVTMIKNPDLNFKKELVVMSDGELALDYGACNPTLIIAPPDKELVLKSVDVKFLLPNAIFQKLTKLAVMNSLPNLSVIGKDGELRLKIHEKSNDTSNKGTVKIGDYAGKDFAATFNAENLKLLPMDYNVEIQEGAFAKFVSTDGKLRYFVALESK